MSVTVPFNALKPAEDAPSNEQPVKAQLAAPVVQVPAAVKNLRRIEKR